MRKWRKSDHTLAGEAALSLCVLAVAALVFGLYGFGGPLYRDYGIYLYGGQRMAAGVPPYAGIFDHKGPLPVMLAGLGVSLSKWLSLDDVYAVRLAFFTAACLAVVAVYLLGRSVFRTRVAGIFSALTFVGFYGFARPAASGPEPKTPLVLFEVLSLLLMTRKKWFWAGFCGSVSLLAWQPAGLLTVTGMILAAGRPQGERLNAVLRMSAGIATPLVVTLVYYWYERALGELMQGLLLFNVLRIYRDKTIPLLDPMGVAGQIVSGYSTMLLPILIGLVMIVVLYFQRPFPYRFAPILLSLPLLVAWSTLDFQVPEDFYIFLPYAAIGFGVFLASALHRVERPRLVGVLLGVALVVGALANIPLFNGLDAPGPALAAQKQSARDIQNRFGKDARIASINAPQVLALLHDENPNPYLFITDGIDREIAATTPGGFEGWVQNLKAYDPVAISFFAEGQRQLPDATMTEENKRELYSWLNAKYHIEQIGTFWLYVKNSPG